MNYQQAYDKLEKNGQLHVLKYYEELTQEEKEEAVRKSTEYYNKNAKPGSIASKANMVKQYNEKNNR